MKNDLVSRSALLKKKTRMMEYDETGCGVHAIVVRADDIENAPAVDAEPVRHGKWIDKLSDCYWPGDKICSECGAEYSFCKVQNYCPNCGARMDTKEAEK